jgi:outer membrane protein assembly factor BamB
LQFPLDAQVLRGERVLIAEHAANRVTERSFRGDILWEKEVPGPIMAQRLPNGNTFIATKQRLLEVNPAGQEVFSYQPPGGELIMKAAKTRTGDYACVMLGKGLVRLDADGKILHSFPAQVSVWGGRLDVSADGHVLVPECGLNRVVEYDLEGQKVWEAAVGVPIAAVRSPNGHLLVTSLNQNRGVEIDRTGKTVWEYTAERRVSRLFRR